MHTLSWETKRASRYLLTTLLPREASLIGNGAEYLAWSFSNELTENCGFRSQTADVLSTESVGREAHATEVWKG